MWETLGALAVQGGPWGLVGFGVLSLMRGWLIPARTHDRIVTLINQRAEDYKAAYETERNTVAERERQLGIVLGRGSAV